MMRLIFQWGMWIYLFSVTLFLSVCAGKERLSQEGPVPVKAVPVTVRETADEVSGFGSLAFVKKQDISASQEGILERLCYREGDRVRRGAVAAVLKNPQISLAAGRALDTQAQAKAALDLAVSRLLEGRFQAEASLLSLEKARLELEQARKALDEQKRKHGNQELLYQAGAVSEETIRDARFSLAAAEEKITIMQKELEIQSIGFREEDLVAAGMEVPLEEDDRREAFVSLATASLQAEKEAAEANLLAAGRELESVQLMESELVVRSEGSGVVGARYMEEGERIKKEDKILTLIDVESLYAVFPLRESDALRVEEGMAARVSVDGAGETYAGKVNLVYPQGDNQSFTFQIRVLLSKPGGEQAAWKLKPGMFARVSIPLEKPRKVTFVPETAVTNEDSGTATVFTVSGDTVSGRQVETGRLIGEEREILSGVFPGEMVVLRPDAALKDGTYVSLAE